MESIPYPSSYFDPFRNEPTHAKCFSCKEIFDIDDMNRTDSGGSTFYFCNDCFEVLEILNEDD